MTLFVTLNVTNIDYHTVSGGFMRVLRRSVLLNEFASSYTWTSCRQSTSWCTEGRRCRSGQQGPNLGSLPKRCQTWLLCLLRWREAYSRQSAADIRSAAISFVDVSLRVGRVVALESPETGVCGKPISKAGFDSVSRPKRYGTSLSRLLWWCSAYSGHCAAYSWPDSFYSVQRSRHVHSVHLALEKE